MDNLVGSKALDEVEKHLLSVVLRATKGNKTEASQALGIYRPSLDRKLRKYGLTPYLPKSKAKAGVETKKPAGLSAAGLKLRS